MYSNVPLYYHIVWNRICQHKNCNLIARFTIIVKYKFVIASKLLINIFIIKYKLYSYLLKLKNIIKKIVKKN